MENLDLENYIYIKYRPVEDYFALRVHGDDMIFAGIYDKSVVICKKQDFADDNDIVIALMNGKQIVRRYKTKEEYQYLVSESMNFKPLLITQSDDFLILGIVIEVRTEIKKKW